MARRDEIRNVIIIAHVDHGKTTLVDCLLRQSGQFRDNQLQGERILDSNDLERERGITILAKNIAVPYQGVKINLIDTPGHADFGGEVERVVRMADGALVLVDAAEGPMPQTRYVLAKALEAGLKPIVVINKIDRPDQRCDEVVDECLDLLVDLGGEEQLDHFTYIFTSAKDGYATTDFKVPTDSMRPVLDLIVKEIPGPDVERSKPLQMLVTTLAWSEYVGRIAIGRVQSGSISKNQNVALMQRDETVRQARVAAVEVFENLDKVEVPSAQAGEIVAVTGLEGVEIGDTICDRDHRNAMTRLTIDQPTLRMVFSVNNSPFAGREGQYVTTRQLRERLTKELERNVALHVEPLANSGDSFAVSGRGIMHLAVLIETMRREGYELAVSKPQVILQHIDGVAHEPFETLVAEVPSERLGPIMEMVGARRGELLEMTTRGAFTHTRFSIPARGLIGLRTKLLNATQGTIVMHHRFQGYEISQGDMPRRPNGVLVSMVTGKAVAFGLDGLQNRAEMFVAPGDAIYEGMIVGENARSEDMICNPAKTKNLTNIRAAGSDDNVILKPPRVMSLEAALEYIEHDELLEVTPQSLRLRKRLLKESDRRKQKRLAKSV